MKKMILGVFVAMGLCFGASVDSSKIEMYWVGYKLANKTPVKGSFSNVGYKFKKTQGNLKEIFEGASAKIALKNLNVANPEAKKNLSEAFFSKFASPEISVKIIQVMEGENQGTLLAKVSMNKKSVLVPMQYTITEGKLEAKGVLDLLSFKLEGALQSLIKVCGTLHQGYTWTQVEIGFSTPLQ